MSVATSCDHHRFKLDYIPFSLPRFQRRHQPSACGVESKFGELGIEFAGIAKNR